MAKIVLTQPVGLMSDQLDDLKGLGNVTYYDTISKSRAEWLKRVEGADIIYTNHHHFNEAWKSLHDTFVTLPFVGVGFLDPQILKEHRVIVSRSPGCNRIAVSEWVAGMLLNYSRRLSEFTSITHFDEPTPFYTRGLYGKSVCVLGKGFIGSRTGQVLAALGMNVSYYTRDDDLAGKVKHADYIVDCLGLNPSTYNFYNAEFFSKTKNGIVFVSVSSDKIKDESLILKLLESGKICHYITDNAQTMLFDTADANYKKLVDNPNVTVTPHLAAYSDNTRETATRMCIDNIKAYLEGKPANTVQ